MAMVAASQLLGCWVLVCKACATQEGTAGIASEQSSKPSEVAGNCKVNVIQYERVLSELSHVISYDLIAIECVLFLVQCNNCGFGLGGRERQQPSVGFGRCRRASGRGVFRAFQVAESQNSKIFEDIGRYCTIVHPPYCTMGRAPQPHLAIPYRLWQQIKKQQSQLALATVAICSL